MKNSDEAIQTTRERLGEVWDEVLAKSVSNGVGYSRYSYLFERFCEELGFAEKPYEQTVTKYNEFKKP